MWLNGFEKKRKQPWLLCIFQHLCSILCLNTVFIYHVCIVLHIEKMTENVFGFQDDHEVDRNEGLKFARKHSMLFIGKCPMLESDQTWSDMVI